MAKGLIKSPSSESNDLAQSGIFDIDTEKHRTIIFAETKEDAIEAYKYEMSSCCAEIQTYHVWRRPSYLSEEHTRPICFSNIEEYYGDGYSAEYFTRRMHLSDPTLREAYFNPAPYKICFETMPAKTRQEKAFKEYCLKAGWTNAYRIGLFGPGVLFSTALIANGPFNRMIALDHSWLSRFSMLSRALHRRLTQDFLPDRRSPEITIREADVISLIRDGYSYTEASKILGVSVNTVNNHMSSVKEKLGARNKTHALFLATELGLAI